MKTRKNWFWGGLKVVVAVAAAALSVSAQALYVENFAIGNWSGGTCSTNPSGDRASWPGMSAAWYNMMGAFGHYKAGTWVDGFHTKRHACDPSYNSNCLDYYSWAGYGYDWADAAIIAYHGAVDDPDGPVGPVGPNWVGLQRYPFFGDGDCWVRGGDTHQMKIGDQWLKFFIASSCFSADASTLPKIRHAMAKSGASKRSHQWDGFHGLMWISSAFNGNYSWTAWDGHFIPISYAWVNNHAKWNRFNCASWDPFNWWGTCRDQCPVAYSIGTSFGDAANRLLNERYNFVFGSPGGNGAWAYLYYPGCHPVGSGPM